MVVTTANDVAEAPFELVFECQAWKFTQDRTLFVLRGFDRGPLEERLPRCLSES